MKQVLYVTTAVLALAFVMALYYYLSIGKQSRQIENLAQVPRETISQECHCDLSFLSGTIFAAPTVQPPLRANAVPALPPYQYLDIDTRWESPTLAHSYQQKQVNTWYAASKSPKKRIDRCI